jgi:hypothetical protein
LHLAQGNEGALKIDPRNLRMGNVVVVIRDHLELVRRVQNRVRGDLGFEANAGPVTYTDPESHVGPMGPFVKRQVFEHQAEYRIALFPGTGQELIVEVGDIRDIVQVFLPSDLARMRFVGRRLVIDDTCSSAMTS